MQQNIPSKKICLSLFLLTAVMLVINFIFFHARVNPAAISITLFCNLFIYFFLWRIFSGQALLIQSQIEHATEEINIISVDNKKSQDYNLGLEAKIILYSNLKRIIEELNSSLKLEIVVGILSSNVYKLISDNRGIALLYLVDKQCQKLNLIHSIKDDSDLAVFTKEGDIFDHWVLRHSSQLLIENLKNDFRFDADNINIQNKRPVFSLISSPLVSNNSLLGLLRLESKESDFFNQDDLRFLSLVSDLGAVALENSLFFQKTQDLAVHDDLTGLYTRSYFIDRLKDEAKHCLRLDQHLSMMMIDIDFFKQYNDKFGHIAGDIVLKKLAVLMKNVLHEFSPLLCRFGGEEFLVMLSGLNKKKTLVIAEELRQRIQKEKITLRRQDTHITVSIGVSSLPLDTKDEDELVQKADKAMYTAKEKGRNQVCSV